MQTELVERIKASAQEADVSNLLFPNCPSCAVGEQEPGKLIESIEEFDEATKCKLLGENALEFLGVTKERFLNGECSDS